MDTFSQFSSVRVTKTTDKRVISNAFKDIIESGRKCHKLWSDDGGGIFKPLFAAMLKRYDIERYTTQSELKAIMIERFNQTIMKKVARMFTERGNQRYIDDIQGIADKYNNTYHSSIKMTPVEASNKENEGLVYYNLYSNRRRTLLKQNRKPKFKIRNRVRLYHYKTLFQKGYDPTWTDEIFIIYKVNPTLPVTYKIMEISKNGKVCILRAISTNKSYRKRRFPKNKNGL